MVKREEALIDPHLPCFHQYVYVVWHSTATPWGHCLIRASDI